MAQSTLQWRRVCEVAIGTAPNGLLVRGDLRIQFEITKTASRTPNTARIRIFNLTPDHENQIRGEYDEVLVNAGYEGAQLQIFRGNIRHFFRPREDQDFISDIDAADGDRAFRNASVNTTFPAGTTPDQMVDHVVEKLTGITKGYTALKGAGLPRGKVVSAPAPKILDRVAKQSDARWSFQDGKLEIVPADSTLPTEAIVLSSETGLLGTPVVDDKGIKAKCLLNPRIRVNGKVKIDNNLFKARIAQQRVAKPGAKAPRKPPTRRNLVRLDPEGIYKVTRVVHKGDTRGDEWTTEIDCVALDKSIPAGKAAA